ncbi:MAG: sigma-70 family RNA polymerase sigma factor [Opitutaceae bacterium]|nr:sigma-70 family RNA polymerase sigma factor [Opitutaceae bacterium]
MSTVPFISSTRSSAGAKTISFQAFQAKSNATSDLAARRAASAAEAAHDAELVQRFQEGDESAFVEIVHRYRGKILGICQTMLRNHADAEDIVQDTFIRAHRGLSRFRGDSSLATWLKAISINLARNRYWFYFRRRRHTTLSLDCALEEGSTATIAELVGAPDPEPCGAAVSAEFDELVSVCMERLPAPHREILTLRNTQHRSYEEIATTLGITVGTVKSRIARARENVRAQLAELCPEFAPDAGLREWFEPVRHAGRLALAVA